MIVQLLFVLTPPSHLTSTQQDLDDFERRMRAEKERQERIKRQLHDSRGKPPPNFRLMSTAARRHSASFDQHDAAPEREVEVTPEPARVPSPQREPERERQYAPAQQVRRRTTLFL